MGGERLARSLGICGIQPPRIGERLTYESLTYLDLTCLGLTYSSLYPPAIFTAFNELFGIQPASFIPFLHHQSRPDTSTSFTIISQNGLYKRQVESRPAESVWLA